MTFKPEDFLDPGLCAVRPLTFFANGVYELDKTRLREQYVKWKKAWSFLVMPRGKKRL